jgi:hypothetical protein
MILHDFLTCFSLHASQGDLIRFCQKLEPSGSGDSYFEVIRKLRLELLPLSVLNPLHLSLVDYTFYSYVDSSCIFMLTTTLAVWYHMSLIFS